MKKQVAAVTTDIADTCAVVLTSEEVRVLGQGGANIVVVNNVVKEAVEKLVVGTKKNLTMGKVRGKENLVKVDTDRKMIKRTLVMK